MNQPILLDTTLRDGEQSPGLYFTHDEKVFLARELDELGVGVIEVGIPSMGPEENDLIRKLARLNLRAEILPWNRLTVEDVMASLDCGVRQIHVSVPTSHALLSRKMNKVPSWVFGQMETVIGFAVEKGLSVSVGAEDASRSEKGFLAAVFRHARELGAIRVRYADTLGILTPEKTHEVISDLTRDLGLPLDFHGHNDFGLATANALAAWKAGAQVISCSLMGLGERAGNTSLEEFVGSCHFLEGQFSGFPFLRLQEVCRTVAFLSGRPIASHKPLFGSEIFHHESGIHVDGLLKNSGTYEFFPPEKVGGKRSLVVGKHSGRAALKHLAAESGFELDDHLAQCFLDQMRRRMAVEKGVDAEALFRSFLQKSLQEGVPLGVASHE